jgi:hypothetical protein
LGPLQSAALKVILAAAAIIILLVRTRKVPREELGIFAPPPWASFLFVAAYLAWMFASDAVLAWRGPWDWQPWIKAPLAASAMRVLAVGILGPIAEELIFRGWFFGILEKRVGAGLTVIATAVGWALLHYSYSWTIIGVIIVDGLILGLARRRTRSVFPPIVMHTLYNLYAIW